LYPAKRGICKIQTRTDYSGPGWTLRTETGKGKGGKEYCIPFLGSYGVGLPTLIGGERQRKNNRVTDRGIDADRNSQKNQRSPGWGE